LHALINGDKALTMQSAKLLDRSGALPRDGTLLFLCDALNREDWRAARQWTDRIAAEGNFGFLAPIVRSWIAAGEGKGEQLIVDPADRYASLARRYIDEHVALLALARADLAEAAPAINRALALRTVDLAELRLTFAAQLGARGATADALALLPEKQAVYARARGDLTRGGGDVGGGGAPLSPKEGVARLLVRLAADIASDDSTRMLAIRLARIASFADPKGANGQLVLAELLTDAGYPEQGVTQARKVAANGWFGALGQAALVDALAVAGDGADAITLARSLAQTPDAGSDRAVRLGQLLAQAKDFHGAADAFRSAAEQYASDAVPWALLLYQGSALEQAGRWDDARIVLERAVNVAPEEPEILNYLGYAQVERRQNVPAALELLKRASKLKPEDAAISDSLGWAQFVTGDAEAAVPVLERAVEGAPADATINEHLGDALWAVGRRYEARYAWRAAAVYAEGDAATRLNGKVQEGMRAEYAAP
jgi:Flp pilus assembly protein TadD